MQKLISTNSTYHINADLYIKEITKNHIPTLMSLVEANWEQLGKFYYLTNKSFEQSRNQIKEKFKMQKDGWDEGERICFVIFWKGKIVGVTSVGSPELQPFWQGSYEFTKIRNKMITQSGLWLRKEAQGRGIGYQVGTFINNWIFTNLPNTNCILKCSKKDNLASIGNIQKQGLILTEKWSQEDDELVFTMTRAQWKKRKV